MSGADQTNDALRILILEEQEEDARRMQHELEKTGYTFLLQRVADEESYAQALEQQVFDLILSEYYLNDFTARVALRLMHERNLDIPFIVVTDSLAEEYVVALMQQGASDYIIKDRMARLGGAVTAALEQRRLRIEKDAALLRLSDSEERFRRIAENAPDILYRMRTQPDIAYEFISQAVEHVLGFAPENFYRDVRFIFQIVHPEDRAKLQAQFELPRVSTENYTLRWAHPDGRTVWTEQRNVRVYNEEGVLVAVEGIARDITEQMERQNQQDAILAVVSALRDAMTRAEIAPVVVEKLGALLNADRVALCTLDPDDGGLRVEAARGAWSAWVGGRLEVNHEALRVIIAEGKPVIHNVAESDGGGAMTGSRKPVNTGWLVGLRTMVCVPMISQEQTMGILCVGCGKNDHRPQMLERILKLSTLVADITASALHRASLYEESRRRVHRLTSLRNINRVLSAGMERSVIVSILLDQLMLHKDVDMVDLLLLDPYTRLLRIEQRRGYGMSSAGEPVGGLLLRLNESLAGRVVLDRCYRSEADLTRVEDGGMQRTMFVAEGMRAYLAAPLMAHGEVLGVLELLRRTPEPFDADWLEFVESLVGQVSTALNNAELYGRIQRSNLDLVQAYDAVIQAWAQAMESRGIEPPGHTRRTLNWTLAMARAFGILDEQLPHIRRGVLLHDIGKMAIPDPIQLKPGSLTPAEISEVRRHPHFAYVWLSTVAYLHPAIDIPYCHHEWWDGSGYPRGLRGAQIPMVARIFTVADVYDVLCSDRPHRPAWTPVRAAAYIREGAGTQFDPVVVTAFTTLLEAGGVEDRDVSDLI